MRTDSNPCNLSIALLVAFVLALLPEVAVAQVQITVSWHERQFVIEPAPPHEVSDARKLVLRLSKDGRLGTSLSASRVTKSGNSELGIPHAIKNFFEETVGAERIRIEGGAIVIAAFRKSHKIITKITTDGIRTCSAERSLQLLPGHNYFEMKSIEKNYAMSISKIEITDLSCSIEDVGG